MMMIYAIFESLTAVLLKIQAFWNVTLGSNGMWSPMFRRNSLHSSSGLSIRWTVEGCLFSVNVVDSYQTIQHGISEGIN